MRDHSTYNTDIANYYRVSAWLYKYMWYSKKSLGLHYGFWEGSTRSHDEALNNQFALVVALAKIKKGMQVLDAGCGVGGGAIYVARETGAKVVGITITPEQVEEARVNAQQVGVGQLTEFLLADYTKMPFNNESFDVVFAVESACYAYPKRLFLDEAYRVLKPGGFLIVSDGYTRREAMGREESELVKSFCAGWRLKELMAYQDMTQEINKAGFKQVRVIDKTKTVLPSLKRMKFLIFVAQPLVWLAYIVPFVVFTSVAENAQSMGASIRGVAQGLMGYYVHVGKK